MVAMTPSDAMPRQATGILAQFPGPVILHQTRLLWIVLLALPWGPIVYLVWRFWPFLTNLTIKGMLVAFVPLGLGPVGIHREFITAATRWIMEAKL